MTKRQDDFQRGVEKRRSRTLVSEDASKAERQGWALENKVQQINRKHQQQGGQSTGHRRTF